MGSFLVLALVLSFGPLLTISVQTCNVELSRVISSIQIATSSTYGGHYPTYVRSVAPVGWCARIDDPYPVIQIDFLSIVEIVSMEVIRWVSSVENGAFQLRGAKDITLTYWNDTDDMSEGEFINFTDGDFSQSVLTDTSNGVLRGIASTTSVDIRTRFLRFHPHSIDPSDACLMVRLFGCGSPVFTQTAQPANERDSTEILIELGQDTLSSTSNTTFWMYLSLFIIDVEERTFLVEENVTAIIELPTYVYAYSDIELIWTVDFSATRSFPIIVFEETMTETEYKLHGHNRTAQQPMLRCNTSVMNLKFTTFPGYVFRHIYTEGGSTNVVISANFVLSFRGIISRSDLPTKEANNENYDLSAFVFSDRYLGYLYSYISKYYIARDSTVYADLEFILFDIPCGADLIFTIVTGQTETDHCNRNRPLRRMRFSPGNKYPLAISINYNHVRGNRAPHGFVANITIGNYLKDFNINTEFSTSTSNESDLILNSQVYTACGNKGCFLLVYAQKSVFHLGFDELRPICKYVGGIPATIKSLEDLQFVRHLAETQGPYSQWEINELYLATVKYSFQYGKRIYHWGDGSPILYSAWFHKMSSVIDPASFHSNDVSMYRWASTDDSILSAIRKEPDPNMVVSKEVPDSLWRRVFVCRNLTNLTGRGNYAYSKPTFQSYVKGKSNHAVDLEELSCTLEPEDEEIYPWLMVDLNEEIDVTSIVLYQVKNKLGTEESYFAVEVSVDRDDYQLCCLRSTGYKGHSWRCICPANTRARYVRVRLFGRGSLSLCEIHIYSDHAEEKKVTLPEAHTNNVNNSTYYTCKSGEIVSLYAVCDHHGDCADGSDERTCKHHDYIKTNNCNIVRSQTNEVDATADEVQIYMKHNSTPCAINLIGYGGNVTLKISFSYFPNLTQTNISLEIWDGLKKITYANTEKIPDPVHTSSDSVEFKLVENEPVMIMYEFIIHVKIVRHDCFQMFKCETVGCVQYSQYCDFVKDCEDGSDEKYCDFGAKSSQQFQCLDGRLVDKNSRCNASFECFDKSDEKDCGVCRETANEIKQTFYTCAKSDGCIPRRLVCNGVADCEDGEDEENCEPEVLKSCAQWWNRGFRKTKLYKLYSIVDITMNVTVECNFDETAETRKIKTVYHNIDFKSSGQSWRSFDDTQKAEIVYGVPGEGSLLEIDGYDDGEMCRQTFTQRCLPNRQEIADKLITERSTKYWDCLCFTLTVVNVGENTVTPCTEATRKFIDSGRINIDTTDVRILTKSIGRIFTHPKILVDATLHLGPITCEGVGRVRLIDGATKSEGHVYYRGYVSYRLPLLWTYVCGDSFDLSTAHVVCRQLGFFAAKKTYISELSERNTCFVIPRRCDGTEELLSDCPGVDHTTPTFAAVIAAVSCQTSINCVRGKPVSNTTRCLYDYDEFGYLTGCSDFTHLQSCENFTCPDGFVKCPNSFCMAQRFYCDGEMDCPNGEDEKYCVESEYGNSLCAGYFRCRQTSVCLPTYQVCDGKIHCLHGDDERLCAFECPVNCSCSGYEVICKHLNDENVISLNGTLPINTRKLDMSEGSFTIAPAEDMPYLALFNLSNGELVNIMADTFLKMRNLLTLDLTENKIKTLYERTFRGLKRLKHLLLQHNPFLNTIEAMAFEGVSALNYLRISYTDISHLDENAFYGLTDLETLDLTFCGINTVNDGAFKGLLNLHALNISQNDINGFEEGMFMGLTSLNELKSDDYLFCCIKPESVPDDGCSPAEDVFSSCEDLMRSDGPRILIWVIGITAILGNILSLVYRIAFDRARLKLGYGIFVTNLAIADLLMGAYLLIIARADAFYRHRYTWNDHRWRHSALCSLAGFLSLVSSEASVFFICLITLDRILVIKFPFGNLKFTSTSALVAGTLVWIFSMLVATLPFLISSYFEDSFYSSNSVCLALPLTNQKPAGWEYSVSVFIFFNFGTFLLITVGQCLIYQAATSTGKAVHQQKRNRDLAVARNLLLVVMTDFLCWCPVGIMGLMAMADVEIPAEVYVWTTVLILPINAALNPFLYTISAIVRQKKFAPSVDEQTQLFAYDADDIGRSLAAGHLYGFSEESCKRLFGNQSMSLETFLEQTPELKPDDALRIIGFVTKRLLSLHSLSMCFGVLSPKTIRIARDDAAVIDAGMRTVPRLVKKREDMSDDIQELGMLSKAFIRLLMENRKIRKP